MSTYFINELGTNIFGGQQYANLTHFYGLLAGASLHGKYDYAAFIRHRPFNFAWLLYDGRNEKSGETEAPFLSDIGLLIKGTEIAEYYLEHNEFPNIALCDDLLFYGRYSERLLYQLEQLLIKIILQRKHMKMLTVREQQQIHSDLVAAVDIFAFARVDEELLLSEDYTGKLYCGETLGQKKLRNLLQKESFFLRESGQLNTGYTLSWRVPKSAKLKPIYQEKINDNLIGTVRVVNSSKNFAAVTVQLIFDDISWRAFDNCCLDVAELLKRRFCNTENSAILSVLQNKLDELQPARAQMLMLLGTLFFFAPLSKKWNADLQDNELNKIRCVFALNQVDMSILHQLLTNTANNTSADVWKRIQEAFADNDKPAVFNDFAPDDEELPVNNIISGENFIYGLGMRAETEAHDIQREGKRFYPYSPVADKCSISRFLGDMRNTDSNVSHNIGLLFRLADKDICSIQFDLSQDKCNKVVECMIKAD